MNKLSKLFRTLPVVFGMMLAACTAPVTPANPDPTPVDPTPAEPVEPTDPVDPVEPVDPTDPVEPVDPVDPALKEFPIKDILAFYEAVDLDVVIPNYTVANEDAYFETDDSFEGFFDVYVTGSSHEEMIDYKDDLLYEGWIVVGTSEDGDYKLQFASTAAFVDLIDYTDYINVSFYHKDVTPVEGKTPEEAINEFAVYFGATPAEVETGIFGFYQAWLYDEEDNNPAALMEYVDMVFEYVLPEFTAASDWAEDQGANGRYFINEIGTAFEVYVYEDNVYVKDGYIVDETEEDAEEVHVVCVETYTYSLAE